MVTTKVIYKGYSPIFHKHPGYKGKENVPSRERFKVYPGDAIDMNLETWDNELKNDWRWELETPDPVKKNKKKKGDD